MAKLKPADYRVNEFDSGVDGVDPITQEGTDVSDDKLQVVEKAASEAGVRLVEIDTATGEVGPLVDATDGALRVAEENDVDLTNGEVKGTLEGGRISQADVEAYLKERQAEKAGENPGA